VAQVMRDLAIMERGLYYIGQAWMGPPNNHGGCTVSQDGPNLCKHA